MKRIHIAVIVSTIDEDYQSGILSGIRQYAFTHDITLEHFVAFGNIGGDIGHDTGEYNIFSLADFNQFDGVILLINTIQNANYSEIVLERARKASVPVVCIDKNDSELYTICIDNEKAMRDMVEHFILYHNYTRINYVSGPKNNIDSYQRLKAYQDILKKYHIPVEEQRIYHGNFVTRDGVYAVQKFLQSAPPQAIICANDSMAIGVMNSLIAHGIRVPEDVAVSGFDYTYNARNYVPSLTSVKRPLERLGQLACEKIMNHVNHIPQKQNEIMETCCCFSQSCGCNQTPLLNTDEFKKRNFHVLESFSVDISLVSRMSSALTECDSFEKYIASLKPFIKEINCKEFYLCLCDNWKQGIMTDETEENYLMHILSPNHYHIHGYGEKILVPLAYKNGRFFDVPDFQASEMLPDLFSNTNQRGEYYFMPLHFGERCMGYCVIKNSDFPVTSKLFHNFMMTIGNSLESVRKIICLDRATRKLNKLYTIDALSEINNRNGFRICTQHLFQDCIREKKPVMLMFLDMDGLKYINDTFGHKAGDNAICYMAKVLRNACNNNEVCCRFGGDEFIVFGANYTEEQAQNLSDRIQKDLEKINQKKHFSYTLAVSTGYHIAIPEPDTNLFQLVTTADNVMYEQKKKRKASKYLK